MRNHLKLIAFAAAAALAVPASADKEKLAFLGVGTSPVHPTLAAQLELAEDTGLAVANVLEDGPASKSGIREHDILAAFDGTALTSPAQLRELVMTRKPGDEVEITLIRHAKEESVKVTLGELPEGLADADGPDRSDEPGLLGKMPGLPFGFGGGAGGIAGPADIDKLFEDMMRKVDPDGVRGFPGIPKGGIFPGGGAAAATSHSSVSMDDGTHKIEMETRDGVSTVKAYDADDNLLYDGPYNTDEEKAAVPEEVRKKLDNIRSDIRILPGRGLLPEAPDAPEPPVPAQKRTI